jgi:hypothetical protein
LVENPFGLACDGKRRRGDHPPLGSTQVPLFFDVPRGISTYTAYHPVTFGVPFPVGTLKMTDQLRVVNTKGIIQPATFDRKTRWDDIYVKWVHIDLLVPVTNGKIPALYLQFGPTVPTHPAPSQPLSVTALAGGGYSVNTQAGMFTVTPTSSSIGGFVLHKVLNGVTTSYSTFSSQAQVQYEMGDLKTTEIPDAANKIRATIKVTGQYRADNGQTASDFVTRYRFYARSATVRIDHTLIRTENDGSKIASLVFTPTTSPSGSVRYGLSTSTAIDLRQHDSDSVVDPLWANIGTRLDGWVEKKSATRGQFIGLRWPWQQYPTRITTFFTPPPSNVLLPRVHLIGPGCPMGLEVEDHVIPPLRDYTEEQWDIAKRKAPFLNADNGPRISPIGVGKTYELMFWEAGTSDPTFSLAPAVRNRLLQHPIYAYADPQWVVKAELPGPNAAKPNSPLPVLYPTIEEALDASFDWMTRGRKDEFDYGIWNFGDVQYEWAPADAWGVFSRAGRYWMNHGKGWGVVPWMLWMRSGERKYIEKAEAHSRHAMDVATGHVDDFKQAKHKGGTYAYEPIHFGQANFPAHISNDSEYLSYAFHIAGDDRAADVILERQHALLTSNGDQTSIPDTKDHLAYLGYPPGPNTSTFEPGLRCLRENYRTFGELAIIYEETHNPDLESRAGQFLDAFELCQAENGWMPGVKTPEWFSQSFLIAARAFPTWKGRIMALLQGWEDHIGMREKPSGTGQMEGPSSLWTLWELEKSTNDPVYGTAIAGYATARALAIHTNFTNSDPETTRWRGYSLVTGDRMASVMRDWMTALAHLTAQNIPAPDIVPAGMGYFTGHLPMEVPVCEVVGRNVVYVLKDESSDTDFVVKLDFLGYNQGAKADLRIRVYDPSSTLIQEHNTLFENNLVDAAKFLVASDTLEGRSTYDKAKTIFISPPVDGQTGAYAIEVVSRKKDHPTLPMAAWSSHGRVVHYVPTYEERLDQLKLSMSQSDTFCQKPFPLCPNEEAPAADPDLGNVCSYALWKMNASLGAMQSAALAGRAWFQPAPDTPIEFVFAQAATKEPSLNLSKYKIAPKLRIFEGTTEKCTTKISGTSTEQTPTEVPCSFTTGSAPGLHSVVLMNDSYYRLYTLGAGSFFASTQAEWFDPTTVAHPPPERFLSPETLP